jgi:hypothetical protein
LENPWKWLQAIRNEGWRVAVHNDYALAGESYTFWLFVKGDFAVKGEGKTDAEALKKALDQIDRLLVHSCV